LSPASGDKARFHGHVGEGTVMVVVKEVVG
jgi:hypothetical protein